MRRFIFILFVSGLCFFLFNKANAQESTMGKEFFVSLGLIQTGKQEAHIKIAAGDTNTVVTLTFNGLSPSGTPTSPTGNPRQINITRGTLWSYQFSSAELTALIAGTSAGNNTLKITATHDVSVYVMNGSSNNADATVILPVEAYGTEYRLAAAQRSNFNTGYVIVAKEAGTTVTRYAANGTTLETTHTLNANQSIQSLYASGDPTGTYFKSNKPIAFFTSWEQTENISVQLGSKNMLYEQLWSIDKWGRTFAVPIVTANDKVRIIASSVPTKIRYWYGANNAANPTYVQDSIMNFTTGGWKDLTPTSPAANSSFYIMADKPIAVASYLHQYPAMVMIPPIQQAVPTITIAPFAASAITSHRAVIVVPTANRATATTMKVGTGASVPLAGGTWYTCASNTYFSFYILPLNNLNVSYTFENEGGVLAMVQGTGSNASYYYVGGAATRDLTNYFYIDTFRYDLLNGKTECLKLRLEYKADMTLPPVSLRWFINNIEQGTFQDSTKWTYSGLGFGQHTVSLIVETVFGTFDTLKTNFTIGNCPDVEALTDSVMAVAGIPNSINVLANDTLGRCDEYDISMRIITPPTRGSAYFDANNRLIYTPPAAFEGEDSLQYKIFCDDSLSSNTRDSAWVYITVYGKPDNIIEPNCDGSPPAISLAMKELARSITGVNTLTNPLSGDIYGTGEIKIVVMNSNNASSTSSNAIHIYGFNKTTNSLVLENTISVPLNTNVIGSPLAIANVNGNAYASIFYASAPDMTLYKYDYNGTSWVQSWATVYTTNATYAVVSPVIANIMGDMGGNTQVVILDKIIDAKSGTILNPVGLNLATHSFGRYGSPMTSGSNIYESAPVVIDIDGDGIQEVIGGDCVYEINIVDFNNSDPGNTFTLKRRTSTAGHSEVGDGGTAVADIDNCGQVEVIVAGPVANQYTTNANGMLYVYNPRTGAVLNTNVINTIPRTNGVNAFGPSRPVVADFTGNGRQRIVVSGVNTLHCYELTTTTPRQLNQVWSHTIANQYGSITPTAFNFKQDGANSGKNRLVLRDQTHLRIIDASSNPPVEEVAMSLTSQTANEFPIIADINGDGSAEIIVTGGGNFSGELYVYASNGYAWAPARSVWNQTAYNATNINENLTVPMSPMSPAIVFSGRDKILGTSDDVRPYNGFLMQQTMINGYGVPVYFLPNIAITDSLINIDGDSAKITGKITNVGEAMLPSPIYVTFYKNDTTTTTNIIAVDTINRSLAVGNTLSFSFVIKNLSNYSPISKIWISVNDSNGKYHYYPECIKSGRVEFDPKKFQVLYEANGGLYARSPIDNVLEGIIYSVRDTSGLRRQHDDSTYFDGWNTKPDGSGDRYRPGEVFVFSGDTVLYAMWNTASGVYDWADLAAVGKDATSLSEKFVLMKNLDKGSGYYETYLGGYGDDASGGGINMGSSTTGWRPLGTSTTPFIGTFDGNNKTISDLWLNRTTGEVGLFGDIDTNSNIYNLTIELGKSGTTAPESIHKAGIITTSGTAGGLVGRMRGNPAADTVKNIRIMSGEVRATQWVGGIIGRMESGCLADTFINKAAVFATTSFWAGGIAGSVDSAEIVDGAFLENTATINARGYVGGIFGYYSGQTLLFSGLPNAGVQVKNSGDIISTGANNGGLFGRINVPNTLTIQDYGNAVNVIGSAAVGGLVGSGDTIAINRCYNTGFIQANSGLQTIAGGIVGDIIGTVSNVYNLGKVSGTQQIGGIIGYANNTSLHRAYNAGRVSGTSAYGMVGSISGTFTSSCLNFDTVTTGLSTGAPVPYNTNTKGVSTCDMHYSLDVGSSGYSSAQGWSYGLNNKHTYPYLTWQINRAGISDNLGFFSISVEMDHPLNNTQVILNIPTPNPANNAFNVYTTTKTDYYKPLTTGFNTLQTTGIPIGTIVSIGVMSESDVVTCEPDSVCKDGFPNVNEITGTKTVCVNESITLTSTTTGGIWSVSNSSIATLSNPTTNSVTVTGVSEGTVFVSYTVGYCVCKTTKTFLLKVTSTPPELKMGFEK